MIHFGTNGIAINLILKAVSGILFLSICLMIDYGIFSNLKYKIKGKNSQTPPTLRYDIDKDVKKEIELVQNLSSPDIASSNLVLKALTKFYDSLLAVNQIHLKVEPSECFGLLGVNGAGKTTTFKMMVGDEAISSGDAWLKGFDLRKSIDTNFKSYCPQFDALLFDLTGREILKIFSLLRGIPRNEINDVIELYSSELDFRKHLDKKSKNYSGGNKRKLSTALSLLGDPHVIFLDEPSTGMDPMAKRKLWDMVNRTRNAGKSVILTSHSIEEAEALCTRLAIMVEGEFKCLGSVQHLKNTFAKGFVLTIKMERDDDDALLTEIKNRVKRVFPTSELKEQYLKLLTFHMVEDGLRWSEAFAKMTQMKGELDISDFILSQMSLEQVFLFFSRSLHN